MDLIPNETLYKIFEYCSTGKDAVSVSKVHPGWKNLMETVVSDRTTNKKTYFAFEECVIDSDYITFCKYLTIELDYKQKVILLLSGNKDFINHFKIDPKDYAPRNERDFGRLLSDYCCSLKIVKFIIEKSNGDICMDSALSWSAMLGKNDVVHYLLDKGANPCVLTPELQEKYGISLPDDENENENDSDDDNDSDSDDESDYYDDSDSDENDDNDSNDESDSDDDSAGAGEY